MSAIPSTQQNVLTDIVIMLVEDDHASARLIAALFAWDRCNVQIAASAEEALALMTTCSPHLILLDLVLPQMSGIVFIEKLKADAATQSIPIVAVSSLNGPETERVARTAGCCAYVKKPIDVDSFVGLVATAFRAASHNEVHNEAE